MEKGKINWAYKIKWVIIYVVILSAIAFIVFALDRIVPTSWLRFGQKTILQCYALGIFAAHLLMQKFGRPKSELPEYFKKHIWLLVLNCVLYFGTIYFGI